MPVISLHELCREQLRHVLSARYMGGGWNRQGDRKVSLRMLEASRLLDTELDAVDNDMVVRPEHVQLQRHLQLAAHGRTLKEVVSRFVQELRALPVPEQADAYAVTQLNQRRRYLDQVRTALTDARATIATKVNGAGVRGVDFDDLLIRLDEAAHQTGLEYDQVEENLAAYEKEL